MAGGKRCRKNQALTRVEALEVDPVHDAGEGQVRQHPDPDRLGGRARQDEPADELRVARGERHRDVATERQADDDRPAAGVVADRVGHGVRGAVQGERSRRRALPCAGRSTAIVRNSPASAACWAVHIAPVSRVPWMNTMAGGARRPGRHGHDDQVEAVLDGEQRGLRPAGQAELGQDVRDVGPGGPLGHPELLGDGPVGQAAGDAGEDVALAGRQPARPAAPLAAPPAASPRAAAHPSGHDPGHGRVEVDLAGRGPSGWPGQVVGLGVLEQEAAGPRLDGGGDPVLLDEAGDRDDLDRRVAAPSARPSRRCRRARASADP